MATEDDFTGPINLGNPFECTVVELADKIIKLTSSQSKIVFRPLPEDDPKQRRPDISLAQKKLNWNPRVTLEEGLNLTVYYFKKQFS